jgi:hypothetical protein
MKQVDVKIGEVVLAKIGVAFVRVRVLSTINYQIDKGGKLMTASTSTAKTDGEAKIEYDRQFKLALAYIRAHEGPPSNFVYIHRACEYCAKHPESVYATSNALYEILYHECESP